MQELLETLENRVLPAVQNRIGCVVTPVLIPERESLANNEAGFIEAYHPEHHPHFEAMWLLSGQAHMKISERVYTFETGDLCFLPPLSSHADVYNRQTPEYESLWFSYSPDVLSVNFFRYTPFGQSQALGYGTIRGRPEIASLFFTLHREANQRDDYSDDAIHALLLQLVIALLRVSKQSVQTVTSPPPHGRVASSVQRYLEEHYADEISLGEIAGMLRLSPNYVASVFKQETGHTIFDTLTQIRVEHAASLLLEETMLIQAVAKAVGYRSTEHFSRVFRRLKGTSPSHYGKF